MGAGLSPHDGSPCQRCGAPLRVLQREMGGAFRFRDQLYIASVYECEGVETHRYRDRLWRLGERVTDISLAVIDPEPLPMP
jgi:hypothetical protein